LRKASFGHDLNYTHMEVNCDLIYLYMGKYSDHSVGEIDKWESAHFREEEARNKAKDAKHAYEDALREKFFGF
jgi:hypothetical protein